MTKIILSKWDGIKYYIRNNDYINKRIKRKSRLFLNEVKLEFLTGNFPWEKGKVSISSFTVNNVCVGVGVGVGHHP